MTTPGTIRIIAYTDEFDDIAATAEDTIGAYFAEDRDKWAFRYEAEPVQFEWMVTLIATSKPAPRDIDIQLRRTRAMLGIG